MNKNKNLSFDDIRTYLEKPRIAYFSTIDKRGYPHTVPVWFAPDGDTLIFASNKNRKRIQHILDNPKVSATIGGTIGDREGYLIQGHAEVGDDSSLEHLAQTARRYMPDEKTVQDFLKQMAGEERIFVRLFPTKISRI